MGFLAVRSNAASDNLRAPELTRVDFGNGHALRLLTVNGRHRGERFGAALIPWRAKAEGPLVILIGAPTFDQATRDVGRLLEWNPSGPEGGLVEETRFGGLPALGKLGLAMSGTGDFDGDGATDLALGSPYASNLGLRAGAVTVLRWQDGPPIPHAQYLRSRMPRANFGTALDAVGDVNRDGFDDLVVGAPVMTGDWDEEGAAYLYLGGAEGLSTNSVWTAWGGQAGMRLGEEVQAAGDVNGDRFADVLVAAPRWGDGLPGYGEVRLYLGNRGGLQSEPAWVYRGRRPYAKAGRGLLGEVDFNGDGFMDVAVGLPSANAPGGMGAMGVEGTDWVLKLTPSEVEVLELLARGSNTGKIAEMRGASVSTVNKQCEAIRRKAEIHNMREAIVGVAPWARILQKFWSLWHRKAHKHGKPLMTERPAVRSGKPRPS